LIACAKSKSQQHVLAISKRQAVPEAVTDVLVVRGSPEVVTSVASNTGANFSRSGFLHLVRRSEGDSILAESVGLRKDIPRHLFHQLIAKASEEVRQKLQKERPDIETQIHNVVVDVTGAIHARFGPTSKDYFTAKRTVAKLHERGELTEDKVFELAHSLKFNETTVALSLLCGLPTDVAERALIEKDREPVLILAKSLDFSWPTTMALLFLGAANFRITAGELERLKLDFHRLNVKACREVLIIYRTRKEEAFGGSFQQSRRSIYDRLDSQSSEGALLCGKPSLRQVLASAILASTSLGSGVLLPTRERPITLHLRSAQMVHRLAARSCPNFFASACISRTCPDTPLKRGACGGSARRCS